MVIVNDCDRPNYGRVGFLCLLPNQLRARQIAERLRPVGVPFLLHELIELVQQLAFNGHAETPQIGHKTDCIGLAGIVRGLALVLPAVWMSFRMPI